MIEKYDVICGEITLQRKEPDMGKLKLLIPAIVGIAFGLVAECHGAAEGVTGAKVSSWRK